MSLCSLRFVPFVACSCPFLVRVDLWLDDVCLMYNPQFITRLFSRVSLGRRTVGYRLSVINGEPLLWGEGKGICGIAERWTRISFLIC